MSPQVFRRKHVNIPSIIIHRGNCQKYSIPRVVMLKFSRRNSVVMEKWRGRKSDLLYFTYFLAVFNKLKSSAGRYIVLLADTGV